VVTIEVTLNTGQANGVVEQEVLVGREPGGERQRAHQHHREKDLHLAVAQDPGVATDRAHVQHDGQGAGQHEQRAEPLDQR
jgi:hypothetical protein